MVVSGSSEYRVVEVEPLLLKPLEQGSVRASSMSEDNVEHITDDFLQDVVAAGDPDELLPQRLLDQHINPLMETGVARLGVED